MSIRQGTAGLIQISSGESYDPLTGITEVVRYKGTHAEATVYIASLRGTGVQATREPIEGTPMSIVSVRVAPEESEVETTWELQPFTDDLSPLEAPRVQYEILSLSDSALSLLNTDILAIKGGTAEESNFTGWGNYPGITAALKALVSGTTYRAQRAILKKTRYVSPSSTAGDTGYGIVATTANLISSQGVPSYMTPQLPQGDWLKSFGGSQFTSDGRKVYTVLYEFKETGGWDFQKKMDSLTVSRPTSADVLAEAQRRGAELDALP